MAWSAVVVALVDLGPLECEAGDPSDRLPGGLPVCPPVRLPVARRAAGVAHRPGWAAGLTLIAVANSVLPAAVSCVGRFACLVALRPAVGGVWPHRSLVLASAVYFHSAVALRRAAGRRHSQALPLMISIRFRSHSQFPARRHILPAGGAIAARSPDSAQVVYPRAANWRFSGRSVAGASVRRYRGSRNLSL
jgi:hypothetical protein